MNELEALRAYLLGKAEAREDLPFGPDTLVLKVGAKMFAAIGLDVTPTTISLKCDPQLADQLRVAYPAIGLPSHLDKRHWVMVQLDGSVPDETVRALIDDSYALVVKGMTRKARQALGLS
jgi:predicted DNA-binding protein (MmcQ/YjbR family)